eukprot:6211188-Pleurochrysis_carterae.AAC.3
MQTTKARPIMPCFYMRLATDIVLHDNLVHMTFKTSREAVTEFRNERAMTERMVCVLLEVPSLHIITSSVR